MKQQKIIKIGNSLGVILPVEYVKSHDFKAGQTVFVVSDKDSGVQISTKEQLTHSLTPEFKQWLDTVTTKHVHVIRELAKK